MTDRINIRDIYDKPLNFLIGSGASYGLLPTLALKVKDDSGQEQSLETLATLFDGADKAKLTALFMHYYHHCVRPAQVFSTADTAGDPIKENVLHNYQLFVETILHILQRRKPSDNRCNIFTTNYDGCFSITADKLLELAHIDFLINDGGRGFHSRYLQPRSFNTFLCQTGLFERSVSTIPQINLIHLHGSVYWQKRGSSILVDYRRDNVPDFLSQHIKDALQPFSEALMSDSQKVDTLPTLLVTEEEEEAFWTSYRTLPVVNPTKWKFYETVFEEHYYHMLRMLSYELEKPNAVLITFGFSFADEHILSLVKRSLSNSSLKVYVCCFDEDSFKKAIA